MERRMKYVTAFHLMGNNRWLFRRRPDVCVEVRYVPLEGDGEVTDYMTAWRLALAKAKRMTLNPFRTFHHVGRVEIYALGSAEDDITNLVPAEETAVNH